MKKKIFSALFAIIICVLSVSTTARADDVSISISSSPSYIKTEDIFTVTVTVSSGNYITAVQGVISYDSTVVEFVSLKSSTSSPSFANGSGGKVILLFHDTKSTAKNVSFVLNFRAKEAGTSPLKISDTEIALGSNPATVSNPTASSSVSVKSENTNLSSNADLSALRISSGSLSPAFSPNVTSYSISLPNSVTTLTVSADTADPNARVSVSGSKTMAVGANKRVITVTAPDGTTKSYTLNITRAAAESSAVSPSSQSDSSSADASDASSSSDVSEEEPTNPLQVYVDSTDMLVAESFSAAEIPLGFHAAEYSFNGINILAASDRAEHLTLLWLTDMNGENGKFYIYRADDMSFEPFVSLIVFTYSYTVIEPPDTVTVPDGFISAAVAVGDSVVRGWKYAGNSDMDDFALLYMSNPDGEEGFYLYDLSEKTLQRYVCTGAVQESEPEQGPFGGILDRLTDNKTLCFWVLAGLAAGCLILLTLTIIFLVLYRKNKVYFLKFK